MNKITTIAGLVIAATAMTASADNLLSIDLSVENVLTITATDGLSEGTVSGFAFVGYMMADFFNVDTPGFNITTTGDLRSAANAAPGDPTLFNGGAGPQFGLNVYSLSTDLDFTAGEVAFAGTASWVMDSDDYAAALAGNTFGNVYAPVDNDADLPGATLLGTWNVVPAPGSMALLGLGGIAAGRRRR